MSINFIKQCADTVHAWDCCHVSVFADENWCMKVKDNNGCVNNIWWWQQACVVDVCFTDVSDDKLCEIHNAINCLWWNNVYLNVVWASAIWCNDDPAYPLMHYQWYMWNDWRDIWCNCWWVTFASMVRWRCNLWIASFKYCVCWICDPYNSLCPWWWPFIWCPYCIDFKELT